MKKYRLRDLVPPWAKPGNHLAGCLCSLGTAGFLSFCFFISQFNMALDMLYAGVPKESPIEAGAQMTYFADLINSHGYVSNFFSEPVFFPFVLLILGAICLAVYNYSGFHNGSKSSYLMRRLPDKWEYLRRCLAFPLLTILLGLVLIPLLTGLFYAIYIHFTPEQTLKPDQWEQFRAHLAHLFIPNFNRGWG